MIRWTNNRVYEAERFYRQKRYKLHAFLGKNEIISGFQVVKINDLIETLLHIKDSWGGVFDFIAVQNQGRVDEFKALKTILNNLQFKFKSIENCTSHMSCILSIFYLSI